MITKKKEYVCAICHRRYISETLPYGWIELDTDDGKNPIDFTYPNASETPDHICERCKLRPFTTFLTEAQRRKEIADRNKAQTRPVWMMSDGEMGVWSQILKARFGTHTSG